MGCGLRNAQCWQSYDCRRLHPAFLVDGQSAEQELELAHAVAAFSLTSEELERQYFDLFDDIVVEIRAA